MSSFSFIPKDDGLIKVIRLACLEYENSFSLPRGTARDKIVQKLNLKSPKELNNYLTNSDKYLRIEQLFLILDIFEIEQQKIILDYIANKYNFILSSNVSVLDIPLNPDFSIFNVNSITGQLNQKYFEFKNNDNFLDEIEIENLLNNSYLIRQALSNFENNLRVLLK